MTLSGKRSNLENNQVLSIARWRYVHTHGHGVMDNYFNHKQNIYYYRGCWWLRVGRLGPESISASLVKAKVNTQPDIPEGVSESADDSDEFGDGKGTNLKRHQCNDTDTPPSSASGSRRSDSGGQNKCINDHLPLGTTQNNIWQRVFVSSLAHLVAGYGDPWNIPDEDFETALQLIWDSVYRTLSSTPSLSAGQFIVSLGQGYGGGSSCSGLLPTTSISFEGVSKFHNSTASKRTLVLRLRLLVRRFVERSRNDNMTFSTTPWGNYWTAVITQGSQYEFNESVWGQKTMHYLEALSDEQYELVVNEVHKYVEKGSDVAIASSMDSGDEDFRDLFLFR